MLKDEIKFGESATLEFKESLPSDSKKYLKTIIAFANTSGGKLVVGSQIKDILSKGCLRTKYTPFVITLQTPFLIHAFPTFHQIPLCSQLMISM